MIHSIEILSDQKFPVFLPEETFADRLINVKNELAGVKWQRDTSPDDDRYGLTGCNCFAFALNWDYLFVTSLPNGQEDDEVADNCLVSLFLRNDNIANIEPKMLGRTRKNYTAKTIATSEVAIPGKRTVLKGLIGHSNSSGDQAPWEWNGENPVLCLALKASITSVSLCCIS
ncbi:hypothetical protein K0M31_014619 [Melipona bicolor]|uniref:Uncharacterized protein n=1 Tax=Melipona bicolor TaxID=60889 RepID=A0AA40FHV7_9HYME|nr:hypothetical protein K0M31_014619 [Melipona bicolor]